MFKVEVLDTSMVCIAAPPSGGRQELSKRFTRHFFILQYPEPNFFVMQQIFQSILESYLVSFSSQVRQISQQVV